MKFLFFSFALLFSQAALFSQSLEINAVRSFASQSETYPRTQRALTAIIKCEVVTYYRAANSRNAYDEQEKSGEVCYLGQGLLYSVNGVLQTQDAEMGAKELHYWAKGE